jgi:hypothetical protein
MRYGANKPCVYILTANGAIRSQYLISNLKELGFLYEIIIGYKDDSNFKADLTKLKSRQSFKANRKLMSDGEIAAMLTHKYAQKKAIGIRNVVFLEDDAILGENFTQQNILHLFDLINRFSNPTVISLYADKWSVFSKLKYDMFSPFSMLKAIFPPAGAVGYLMSDTALIKATSSPLDFELPADWPSWSKRVDFYYAFDKFLYVDQNPNLSLIKNRSKSKFDKKEFFFSFFRIIGFRPLYGFQMLQPFIWKFALIFGKPYRECSDDELVSISRIFPRLN